MNSTEDEQKPDRRRQVIAAAILFVVIVAVGVAVVRALEPSAQEEVAVSATTSTSTTTTLPKPVLAECPTTGVEVAPSLVSRRPLGVVIENHSYARPQSGLDKADIVYEVVAEGGITRFFVLFVCGDSNQVGPIRSVREYFADIAYSHDAALSHCGGAPSGYARLRALGVDDLDQFANGSYYWRSRNRRAPHNLYTTTAKLRRLMAKNGWDKTEKPVGAVFKDDAPPEERPQSGDVAIDFSSPRYKVKWVYESGSNRYQRYVGGVAHNDSVSGEQLTSKNVVVAFTSIYPVDSRGRVRVDLSRGGRALVFRDGRSVAGVWQRRDRSKPIRFKSDTGEDIELNRGNTWVEIVKSGRKVKY